MTERERERARCVCVGWGGVGDPLLRCSNFATWRAVVNTAAYPFAPGAADYTQTERDADGNSRPQVFYSLFALHVAQNLFASHAYSAAPCGRGLQDTEGSKSCTKCPIDGTITEDRASTLASDCSKTYENPAKKFIAFSATFFMLSNAGGYVTCAIFGQKWEVARRLCGQSCYAGMLETVHLP